MECIVQLIEKQDDVEDIIRLMIAIGHIALDIDLANIPFEDMKSEKDVQRFFSNEENLLKYSPNKRFNVLVSVLFRQKKDVKMLEFVEKGSLENVEWELEKSVNSAKKAVERIFQNDWRWERIHQRISTIGENEIAYQYGENSAMMVLPIDLNKTEYDYNHKYLKLGDFLSTLTQEQYANTIVRLEHHVGGFEEVKFLSLCDYKNKIVYVTFVTDEDLYLNVVSHISQTIVFI